MRWLLIASGCASTSAVTAEDPVWEGPILIEEVVIVCEGTQDWTYDVQTEGWGDVTVDVVARQYGALLWTEHHEIPEVERGEDWAHHSLVLAQATSETEQVSGQSTFFACEGKTFLTYGFATWKEGELEECIAWGIDPVGEFPDCANWGEDGH